jgi:hypothetical protein
MTITDDVGERSNLPASGRIRSPTRQFLLTLVTFGVHLVVHHWTINRELSRFGVEVDPVRAAFAVFPGGLVVVPYLVTVHRTANRIGVAQETLGLPLTVRPPLATAAALATLHVPYLQRELNRVWRADGVEPDGDPSTESNNQQPRSQRS